MRGVVRSFAFALALLALSAIGPWQTAPVDAQSASICPGVTRTGTPFATERKTVSSTAVTLTAATFKPGSDSTLWARYAVVSVETDDVRFSLISGTAPTASTGHLLPSGSYVTVCGVAAITNLQLIRVTTDAAVQATYFR